MSPEKAKEEALFHSRLVQQANSYMNACFSISSARCGLDDGKYDLIAGSSIVSPEGHVIAEAQTSEDELVVAEIDLRDCRQGKRRLLITHATEGSRPMDSSTSRRELLSRSSCNQLRVQSLPVALP